MVRIWLGTKRNPDGTENKPYRRSMGPWNNANIQRANNHIDEIRENFRKGLQPQPEPQPLSFVAGSHIYFDRHWKNKRGRSAGAIKNIEYLLIRFRRQWAAKAVHTFNSKAIEDYAIARKKEGAAAGTINKELGILSSIFSKLSDWNDMREIGPFLLPTTIQGASFNPAAADLVDRESTASAKRERVASEIELIRVKKYCDANDPDMLIMIVRSLLTGLRKSDLERVNGLSNVRGILSKSKEKKLFRFHVDFSQKISYTNYPRRWDDLREACDMLGGEKNFHWHDWRHTSATMLSLLGFSDEDIRRFLGHSSVEQTRAYINRTDQLKPQVDGIQNHLDKVFGKAPAYVPPDATTKACKGCDALKPLEAYYRNVNFKSGLDSRCKACCDEKRDKRRAADPTLRAREWERRNANDPGLRLRERDRVREIRLKAAVQ